MRVTIALAVIPIGDGLADISGFTHESLLPESA